MMTVFLYAEGERWVPPIDPMTQSDDSDLKSSLFELTRETDNGYRLSSLNQCNARSRRVAPFICSRA